MTALPSRTRALTLAALVIFSTFAVVVTPATVSAQASDEPNDTKENATAIETNDPLEGEIDYADGDGRDVDWYRFDVASGNHLRVISFEGYGAGSTFTLYGPDGTVLGSGEEYGTEDAPVAGTTNAAGGTYYLKVAVEDGVDGESYGFSVETTAPDAFEPNEKRDEAIPTEPGTARSGVIATGDTDWFAVSVAAGETLDATIELTDTRSLGHIGSNNVDLALYDPSGNEVGENPEDVATNNAPADQTSRFDGRFAVTQRTVAEEDGTYYIRVTGVGTTGFSTYDLATTVSGANGGDGSDDDGDSGSNDTESGDDDESVPFENATAVDSFSAIGSGQIDADGNADVYSFEMREGSQIELSQGIGGGAYPVTLLDESGNVLGRITDQDVYRGEEDLLRANASDTGTYYLTIDGASGDRYSILGSVTEPDTNEPNDDRTTATRMSTDDAGQGTIVRGDTDYYAVQLDAGETVDVFANASARAALTVSGPGGSTIESVEVPSRFDPDTGTPVTSVTATESGTYYLELSIQPNAIGQVGGEYAIELRSAGGADDEQPSSDGSSEGGTGDDGSNTEEPTTDGSGTSSDTTPESATPAPTEQTTVETADGTTNADTDTTTGTATNEAETGGDEGATSGEGTSSESAAGETTSARTAENTPENSADEGAVTTSAGDAPTADSGRTDDTTPETDATTMAESGSSDESTADGTDATDDGGTTADASTTGDDTATDAGTAGTTSGANTTENASDATSGSSGEAGTQAEETDGTAPSGGAEKTAVDGPGFGLLAALLAILSVAAFALGRD